MKSIFLYYWIILVALHSTFYTPPHKTHPFHGCRLKFLLPGKTEHLGLMLYALLCSKDDDIEFCVYLFERFFAADWARDEDEVEVFVGGNPQNWITFPRTNQVVLKRSKKILNVNNPRWSVLWEDERTSEHSGELFLSLILQRDFRFGIQKLCDLQGDNDFLVEKDAALVCVIIIRLAIVGWEGSDKMYQLEALLQSSAIEIWVKANNTKQKRNFRADI